MNYDVSYFSFKSQHTLWNNIGFHCSCWLLFTYFYVLENKLKWVLKVSCYPLVPKSQKNTERLVQVSVFPGATVSWVGIAHYGSINLNPTLKRRNPFVTFYQAKRQKLKAVWKGSFLFDSGQRKQRWTKTDTHNLVRQIGFVISAEGSRFVKDHRLQRRWIVTFLNSFRIAVQSIKEARALAMTSRIVLLTYFAYTVGAKTDRRFICAVIYCPATWL